MELFKIKEKKEKMKNQGLSVKERFILLCLQKGAGLKVEELVMRLQKFNKNISVSHEELNPLIEKGLIRFEVDARFKRTYFKV